MKKFGVLVGAVAMAAANLCATEYFVDCNRPDDSGDGRSEATAKRTIQAAIAAAEADAATPRIVTVLPGTYAEGGKVSTYACTDGVTRETTNRVHVTKALSLRAKSSDPSKTVIEGNPDPVSGGMGFGAVRCVLIDTSASVVIEGFTIRNGYAHDDNVLTTSDNVTTAAGGVARSQGGHDNFWVVNCRFTGCVGNRGGSLRGGTALRCRFFRSGNAQNSTLVFSLVGQSTADHPVTSCTLVNTTVADNAAQYMLGVSMIVRNSLVVHNSGTFMSGSWTLSASASLIPSGTTTSASWSIADDCLTSWTADQFFAPANGDFRLVEGSDAIGRAKMDALAAVAAAAPEGVDVYKDFNGQEIDRAATTLNAGCCQEVKAKPTFAGKVALTGVRLVGCDYTPVVGGMYFYPESYPTQYHIVARATAAKPYLHSYTLSDSLGWSKLLPPEMDDSLYFMPSEDPDVTVTCAANLVDTAYWVNPDPAIGSDGNDGSEDHPYLTLAKAVSKTTANKATAVVFAAEGVYSNGVDTTCSWTNRVGVAGGYRVKGKGRGRSIIEGAPDKDAADGRGPGAIRAVVLASGYAVLQGFTIRKGYNRGVTTSDTPYFGGGAYVQNGTLADCSVEQCCAYRGAAIYTLGSGAWIYRTIIVDNMPTSSGGGSLLESASNGYGRYYSSVLGLQAGTIGAGGYVAFGCTIVGKTTDCKYISGGTFVTNSIIHTSYTLTASWSSIALGTCAYWNFGLNDKFPSEGCVNVNPGFVDKANGDYRLFADSPARGVARQYAKFHRDYCTDLYGRPLVLLDDDKLIPGAIQVAVQKVEIATSPYAELTPSGTVALDPGESVEVSIASPLRPPRGISVDGVVTEGTVVTYTAPAGEARATPVGIEAVFGTNWYVNAAMLNDDGDGFTPETAKRTLCGAMTNKYVIAGDVVHVAEGVYDEGSTGSSVTKNRVSVKAGVTLVADGAMDKTLIVGAPAPVERSSNYPGCGEGAVRCAFVSGTGILRGFVITNGYTEGDVPSSSSYAYCYGGGVLAETGGRIEDCQITQCRARRGSGACGGYFRRCRFWKIPGDPYCDWGSYGVSEVSDCYLDYCGELSMCPKIFVNNFVGCYQAGGTTRPRSLYTGISSAKVIRNCIFCANIRNQSNVAVVMTNCVYTGLDSHQAGYILPTNEGFGGQMSYANITAQLAQDDQGRWTIKGDSAFVNQDADTNGWALAGSQDLNGGQRVYDGVLDIGPWEWDWRPTYTRTIAQPGVSVRDAAPMVVREDEKVRIYDGDLVMNWTASSRKATIRRRMTFLVTGTGTLTVFADGEELGTYTQAAEPQMVDFRNALETSVVKFSYAKGADDAGYVEIGETIGEPGALLIIR